MNAFCHALTPARALLLAALLLLAQAAGLAHRVAHGATQGAVSVAATQARVSTVVSAVSTSGHGLIDHQQAGAECRLYDQLLGQADALPATPLLAVTAPADDSPATAPLATACAASAAAYQARAPPAS